MKPLIAMITCLLASTLAVSPAPGQTLSGEWCGEAEQTGPGDYRSRWSAILALKGPTGRMDYPSLECGGTLTFEHARGTVFFYRERIDYGRDLCLDGGLIGIEPLGASVRWEWNGLGATATAMLTVQCRLQSEHTTPQNRIINGALRAPLCIQYPRRTPHPISVRL
jgi:hypothetical protein